MLKASYNIMSYIYISIYNTLWSEYTLTYAMFECDWQYDATWAQILFGLLASIPGTSTKAMILSRRNDCGTSKEPSIEQVNQVNSNKF